MAGSPVSRLTPPESKDTMALEPAFIFAWPAAWPEAKLEVSPDEVPPAFVPPRVFSGVEATAMRTAQSRAPSPCATMGAGMSSGRRRATAPLARRRTSGPSLCGTKPANRPSTSSAAARPRDMSKRVLRRFMGIPVGNGTAYGLPPSDGCMADLTALPHGRAYVGIPTAENLPSPFLQFLCQFSIELAQTPLQKVHFNSERTAPFMSYR